MANRNICFCAHFNQLLYKNSKKDVEKRTENVNKDENPSGWRPYCTFVEVLREKCVKNEVFQGTLCNFFSILIITLTGKLLSL